MIERPGAQRRIALDDGVERGPAISIEFDGQPVAAYEGETVAAAVVAAGKKVFRSTARLGAPRGLYCGMGVCYDCLVVVDGCPNRRACMTRVAPGLRVQTQSA